MNIPKTYFQNTSAARYKEYLKLLPKVESENTQLFVMLALTFGALIFFGIFAINPTITTIVQLRKELEENKQVDGQLRTKIANLSALHQQYSDMEPELFYVYDALPQDPKAPLLSAQIAALGQKNGIKLTSYRVAQVQIANSTTKKPMQKDASFIFLLQATGTYEAMMAFTKDLGSMNRIVTLESLSIAKNAKSNTLTLTLRGRQYFKP